MQIMFFAIILVAAIAFLIYRVNNNFGTKEIFILLAVLVIPSVTILIYLKDKEDRVPNMFIAKYEKSKNAKIVKLSYERLNNKYISSKTNFIYDFDYIITKDSKEFVCTAKKVKIKKIEDEYIFENFNDLDEKCNEK